MAKNTKNQMSRILTNTDPAEIKARGPGGFLARLFQTILIDLQITNAKWDSLMNDYINDPRNNVPKDRNQQTSRRGNLVGELSHTEMTLKVICKGLRLLQFVRVEVTLRAYHRHGGRVSEHSIGVDLENPQAGDRILEPATQKESPELKEVPSKTFKGLDQ